MGRIRVRGIGRSNFPETILVMMDPIHHRDLHQSEASSFLSYVNG